MRKFFKNTNWLLVLYLGTMVTIILVAGRNIGILEYTYQVYYPVAISIIIFATALIGSIIEKIVVEVQNFILSVLDAVCEDVYAEKREELND